MLYTDADCIKLLLRALRKIVAATSDKDLSSQSEWGIETAQGSMPAGAVVFAAFIHSFIHSFIRSFNLFTHSSVSLSLLLLQALCFRAPETGTGTKRHPAGEEGARPKAHCLYSQWMEKGVL